MTDVRAEDTPAKVRNAKQAGEVRARWAWTEPSVWTERMLTALEEGVKGGVWFSLMDKVYSVKNLKAAWEKVKANKGASGIDRQSIEAFQANEGKYLEELQESLRVNRYEAKPVKRVWIPKLGSKEKRPLGIPALEDKLVQLACAKLLTAIYEQEFLDCSYGYRPGRGALDAVRGLTFDLQYGTYGYVVEVDIKGFFGAPG